LASMPSPAADPCKPVDELVGHLLWLDWYEVWAGSRYRWLGTETVLAINGYARPPGEHEALSPADFRLALHGQAEAAIAALESAGYKHVEYPKIEFEGKVMYQADTGDTPHLRQAACTVRLVMRVPS
jgi:hypothetical protein